MDLQKRNYGIDLLRVVAMFFVIVLHALNQGGLIDIITPDSIQYPYVCLLEIIVYCSVNIFALISGYVSYNKGTKYENYISLWFQVVFYLLLITTIYQIVTPNIVTEKDYIRSFFPVSGDMYWYFTAYTGLFLLKPLIDKSINTMEENNLKKVFVVIVIGFSVWDIFINRFTLRGGYSVIWIVLLYILGSIINKCQIGKNLKQYQAIILMLVFVLITYLVKMYGNDNCFIINDILNLYIGKNILVNYTSPTILGIAVLFVISFSKLQFKGKIENVISFASISVFSVYLLNTHYVFWDLHMKNLFADMVHSSVVKIYVVVLGFSLLFVLASILIDKVRLFVFKILKINMLSKIIAEGLNKLLAKISDWL